MIVTFPDGLVHTKYHGSMPHNKYHSDVMAKDFLGGKGFGLLSMGLSGLPIPAGGIIPVAAMMSNDARQKGVSLVVEFVIKPLIEKNGPLTLFSVRSGAPVSMPGMMDTVLNLGICKDNIHEIYDCFGPEKTVRMVGDLFRDLLGLPDIQKSIDHACKFKYGLDKRPKEVKDFTVKHIIKMVRHWLPTQDHEDFFGDHLSALEAQLDIAVSSVLCSWFSERAKTYRQKNNLTHIAGTACVIQKMVFGNLNKNSCTGVFFTRNPSTGFDSPFGEFLPNAQGEDVVSGKYTPLPMLEMRSWNRDVFRTLMRLGQTLEKKYKDMQDIEFTVEDGVVYLLQTRSGKRSSKAAFRIAHDLVAEGVVSPSDVPKLLTLDHVENMKMSLVSASAPKPDITGVGVSGGASVGRFVSVSSLEKVGKPDEPFILIADETNPVDYPWMCDSVGIITRIGGSTSHAAVVARAMDKPCIVGAGIESLEDLSGKRGTMEGVSGRVWISEVEIVSALESDLFVSAVKNWVSDQCVNRHRCLTLETIHDVQDVRANALVLLSDSLKKDRFLLRGMLKRLAAIDCSPVFLCLNDPRLDESPYTQLFSDPADTEILVRELNKVSEKIKDKVILVAGSPIEGISEDIKVCPTVLNITELFSSNRGDSMFVPPEFFTDIKNIGLDINDLTRILSESGRRVLASDIFLDVDELLYDVVMNQSL